MLKNYIAIAWRNILKQKVFSFINISGLSIGFTASILIFLYVHYETSYDEIHHKGKNIYKVYLERIYPDHITNYAIIPHSFAPVMASDLPGVINSVRLFGNANNQVMVRYESPSGDKKEFEETRYLAADSTFFDIFTVPIIKGNAKKALTTAGGLIITNETANRYFDNEDPIGKMLQFDFGTYQVMAICENIPDNSHFDFDFLYGTVNVPFLNANPNFVNFSVHTYLELDSLSSPETVEKKIPELVREYAGPQIQQTMDLSYEEYLNAGNGYNYSLVNLYDVYLTPTNYQQEFKPGGNKNDIVFYFSIGILIIVIAGINFTNLAVARSTERGREVGIRKCLGSIKSQLVGQFLTESIMMSVLSMVLALGLAWLFLPVFNGLVDKDLSIVNNGMAIIIFFIIAIFIGILSGFYPAFVISNINTITVLKGGVKKGKKASLLRNILVTIQFCISIILIIATFVMNDQMSFIRNKNLGFEHDNVLVVERAFNLENQQKTFINEVKKLDFVENAAASTNIPANQYFGISFQKPGSPEPFISNGFFIDDNYLSTHNYQILQGDGFSIHKNDSLNIVINEEMARLLNIEQPIGAKIEMTGANPNGENPEFTIVGIVQNFHYMSMKETISPFVFLNIENINIQNPIVQFVSVKMTEHDKNAVSEIENIWNKLINDHAFQYSFLSEELDQLYQGEMKSGEKMATFAGLAILIACIGLFGLSAYTSSLRIKEIGIRKVLGASIGNIVLMLVMDFLKWVAIAFIIAIPIGYFGMVEWLKNFAYRTEIEVLKIIYAGLITFFIAIITVSYQSVMAGVLNPVKSLKSE